MEYFYRQKHPGYKTLPPFAPGCSPGKNIPVMEFIYPTAGIKIFIPRDQSGLLTRVIAEVAHRNPSKKLFWHLDEKYLGTTRYIHQTELQAETGTHILTVVDEDGNSIRSPFYYHRQRRLKTSLYFIILPVINCVNELISSQKIASRVNSSLHFLSLLMRSGEQQLVFMWLWDSE